VWLYTRSLCHHLSCLSCAFSSQTETRCWFCCRSNRLNSDSRSDFFASLTQLTCLLNLISCTHPGASSRKYCHYFQSGHMIAGSSEGDWLLRHSHQGQRTLRTREKHGLQSFTVLIYLRNRRALWRAQRSFATEPCRLFPITVSRTNIHKSRSSSFIGSIAADSRFGWCWAVHTPSTPS
jgi:hypothetical protein